MKESRPIRSPARSRPRTVTEAASAVLIDVVAGPALPMRMQLPLPRAGMIAGRGPRVEAGHARHVALHRYLAVAR